MRELKTYLILWAFSVPGTYTRLGLEHLTDYRSAYVQPATVLWANVCACFCMGVANEIMSYKETFSKLPFSEVKKIPLFIGFTTGYCGTVSSFSTFMLEIFNNAANQTHATDVTAYPNAAYGIMEFLAVVMVHMGCSYTAFLFGKQVVDATLRDKLGKVSVRFNRIVECILMSFGAVVVIVHVVLSAVYHGSSRRWTLSAVFGIFGTCLRYELAKHNARYAGFPIGTFAANVIATLVLAVLNLVNRGLVDGSRIVGGVNTCMIVGALGDGFCGGLSTVSTFVVEIYTLKSVYSIRYWVLSIAVCFSLVVVTLGTYAWTRGLTASVC